MILLNSHKHIAEKTAIKAVYDSAEYNIAEIKIIA